jgi:hypothetical protein
MLKTLAVVALSSGLTLAAGATKLRLRAWPRWDLAGEQRRAVVETLSALPAFVWVDLWPW